MTKEFSVSTTNSHTDHLVTEQYRNVSDETLQEWVGQFHRDGYLFRQEYLTPEFCAELKADLDKALTDPTRSQTYTGKDAKDDSDAVLRLRVRMFEVSPANLRLFDLDPIAKFAETLIGTPDCHVIHNNSFITKRGGGISNWHQDDPPHYLVTHGAPPTNVRLPVLFFTANYYLTDVTERAIGGTEVIPRSHLFGRPAPKELPPELEEKVDACLGKAGSVVMFNNQVWHRGGPNQSDHIRYITQVTYGRRMINTMYYPFMNYVMPEHVYKEANPRLKQLLGFLNHGPYG
jgi:ectoine hydroxylase-related dioxygenase (phytanoyl-CoA dioxygenase family)